VPLDEIIKSFNHYIESTLKQKCSTIWNNEELEIAIKEFLSKFTLSDIDESFNITKNNDMKFIAKYFLWTKDNNNRIYTYFCHCFIGNIILNLETYPAEEFKQISNMNFYLDTPLLISLMKVDGQEAYQVISNIISILREKQCVVKIFKHSMDELNNLFNGAVSSATHTKYDMFKASPFSKFLRKNFKNQFFNEDIWFDNEVKQFKTLYGIQIDDNSYNTYEYTPYDLGKQSELEEFFWGYGDQVKKSEINNAVTYDLKSFNNIYKLCKYQKGVSYKKWKDLSACFITDNTLFYEATHKIYNMDKDFKVSPMIILNHLLYLIYMNNREELYETINLSLLRYIRAYTSNLNFSKEPEEIIKKIKEDQELDKIDESVVLSIISNKPDSVFISDIAYNSKLIKSSTIPTIDENIIKTINQLEQIPEITTQLKNTTDENTRLSNKNEELANDNIQRTKNTKVWNKALRTFFMNIIIIIVIIVLSISCYEYQWLELLFEQNKSLNLQFIIRGIIITLISSYILY